MMCGWAVFTGIPELGSQTSRCVTPSPLVGEGGTVTSVAMGGTERAHISDKLSVSVDSVWTAVTRPCNGGSQLWL